MTPEPTEPIPLGTLVGRIMAELESVSSAGDLAELRRLDPDHPGAPTFWRLVVAHLDPSLPNRGQARDEALKRWAAIMRAMAEMARFHDPRLPLGAAMAQAGVAEMRVLKLLRANGESLSGMVRMLSHQLAAAAVAANLADVARLVLSDGRSAEESVRNRIAYDYYARMRQREKEIV